MLYLGQNLPQGKRPNIDLPTFEGKLEDWAHFRDLLLSLIYSNEDLSDIEKVIYLTLKSSTTVL